MLHQSKHIHQVSTFNHVIVHCTYFVPLIVVCRLEVEPEPEGTPFVEDPEPEPRQQGKQPPIDHADKIPIPSHSLMHKKMFTLYRSFPIVEPNPLHDLSFCPQ